MRVLTAPLEPAYLGDDRVSVGEKVSILPDQVGPRAGSRYGRDVDEDAAALGGEDGVGGCGAVVQGEGVGLHHAVVFGQGNLGGWLRIC